MADAGGWQWSDVSGMAAAGAFLATIAGWFHKGLAEKTREAAAQATAADRKADEVGKDLAAYKVTAVEKFVPRAHLDQVKAEIIQRIDTQDAALRMSFGQVTERLDRILEARHGGAHDQP